jgi:hypothetical protein
MAHPSPCARWSNAGISGRSIKPYRAAARQNRGAVSSKLSRSASLVQGTDWVVTVRTIMSRAMRGGERVIAHATVDGLRERNDDSTSVATLLADTAKNLFVSERDQRLYRVLELTYLNWRQNRRLWQTGWALRSAPIADI